MLSLVIPVYRNEENLPRLFGELERLAEKLPDIEIVFVVDGSPDASLAVLQRHLPTWTVRSQLIELSRNFGSFPAIVAGLASARGEYMAVIAADLQEPPDLVLKFHALLTSGSTDVVLGHRTAGPIRGWRGSPRTCSGVCIADSSSRTSRRAASTCSAARARSAISSSSCTRSPPT